MTVPADQCPFCSTFSTTHDGHCPETTGVWPAQGDEVCGVCSVDVGDVYALLEHTPGVEVVGEPDLILCLGCAAHRAIGASS